MAERKWELTPEEMDAALEVGAKRYLAAYEAAYQKHKAGEVVLYPSEFHIKAGAIANAAVEKVVEWLKDNNQPSVELREEGGFHIEAAVRLDGFLVLPEKEWAELKQEVGL